MNGYQRIGIVLTVAWAISTAIWQFSTIKAKERENRLEAYNLAYEVCDQHRLEDRKYQNCNDKAWEAYKNTAHEKSVRLPILATSVILPAFVWMCVSIIISITRWIMKGFKRKQPQ